MYPVIDSRNYAPSKSLNRDKRLRELQRITEENQKMLQRIQSRRPFYDHNRWDEQHKRDLKYLENIRSRELLMIERARTPGTPRRPRPATMSPTRASALPGIAQRGGTAPVRSLAAGLVSARSECVEETQTPQYLARERARCSTRPNGASF